MIQILLQRLRPRQQRNPPKRQNHKIKRRLRAHHSPIFVVILHRWKFADEHLVVEAELFVFVEGESGGENSNNKIQQQYHIRKQKYRRINFTNRTKVLAIFNLVKFAIDSRIPRAKGVLQVHVECIEEIAELRQLTKNHTGRRSEHNQYNDP